MFIDETADFVGNVGDDDCLFAFVEAAGNVVSSDSVDVEADCAVDDCFESDDTDGQCENEEVDEHGEAANLDTVTLSESNTDDVRSAA